MPLGDHEINTSRDLTKTKAQNKEQQSSPQKENDFVNLILKDVDWILSSNERTCNSKNEEINVNADLIRYHGYNPERKLNEKKLKEPRDIDCFEQINRVSKLQNLERKLAARRALKIDRGVECLRQPSTKNTSGTLKRVLFSPSVISLMGDTVKNAALPADHDRYEKKGNKKTLCQSFLQLLPIAKAVKTVDFSHPMKPRPTLPKLVPKITCEKINLRSNLNSGVLFQKEAQKNISKSNKVELVVLPQIRKFPL